MRSIKKFFKKTFRYDLDRALFIACCMLVCLMIYGILATVFPHYDIGGKNLLKENTKLCSICMMTIFSQTKKT